MHYLSPFYVGIFIYFRILNILYLVLLFRISSFTYFTKFNFMCMWYSKAFPKGKKMEKS